MNSVAFPVIIPLCFAFLLGVVHAAPQRRILALAGFALHVVASAWLLWFCHEGDVATLAFGEWKSPYGIILVADIFACLFLLAISLVFFVTYLYSLGEDEEHHLHILRFPLLFVLQAGISLSLLTGDFFNLFVAFEMMLAASYALVTLELPSKHLKWALSYLLINLIGAFGFLCAAAMIYGYTGHLNMGALAQLLKEQGGNPLIQGWSYLLLGVFGLKAGLFPLYFWLPKTYAYLPTSLVALFAGSLTKVGIYVLIRLLVLILPAPLIISTPLLLTLAGFTMLFGVLGALSRATIKGILSYHIVSQIGYMFLGIALYTPVAIASTLLFVIHNIWVKVSLFLIGGIAQKTYQTDNLKKMGNLSLLMPWLAASFLIQAFALIGLPPLSGFWGKYLLVLESLRLENYWMAGLALVTSWLTLFSMIKIWLGAFWQTSEKEESIRLIKGLKKEMLPISLLILASLSLGFGIEYAYQMTHLAAEQIFHKEAYLQAVFNAGSKGML